MRQGRRNHRVTSARERERERRESLAKEEKERERERRMSEKLDGSNVLSAASRKLDGVDAASSMQIDVA